ncbi:flagellar motor switch protein FliG [Rhodobacter sp. 140A]|uniref:Flagellar motor switch protein FliG n=1 Tax=bioreactor metagenome TaxID=1076179 RepID=A0A644U1I7_9ZZZZ|nr:flagellar motor switch protein FliG [Rhodobacter sp. 140A]
MELARIPPGPQAGAKPVTATPVITLSPQQKAAIIVRLLSSEGMRLPLAELSEDQQTELTAQIGAMKLVDRDTLHAVVAEFCEALEAVGLTFPNGLDGALSLLDGQLSSAATSRLRRLALASTGADPWERILGLSTETLLPVMTEESVEVAAVLLSKLAVPKAAELLGRLPGERARRIAYAVSLTGNVAPETVQRIGIALAQQLDSVPARAFDTGAVERVGAILNQSAAATREDVLIGLEEEDQDFAEKVRKAIFTFTNIPQRIDARDVPRILRNVEQPQLIVALAGATGADEKAAEFILANLSQRMAASLREEMATLGKLRAKDVEAAMATVVGVIREMEATGALNLLAEDDAPDPVQS